jgi:hypothetical protein
MMALSMKLRSFCVRSIQHGLRLQRKVENTTQAPQQTAQEAPDRSADAPVEFFG